MSCLVVLLLCQAIAAHPPTAPPLPDATTFVQEIRKKLRSDRALLSQYTYSERVTAHQLDKSNRVTKTIRREFEIYPSLDEDLTYRRLVSKDGRPLSPQELEKQDREYTNKAAARQSKLEREGTDEKARRLAKEAEERRKENEIIDEVFLLYEGTLTGRTDLGGQQAIELTFQPRPGYRPKSREARMLSKIRGRAWFGEKDHEMIRIEAELIDDISLGMGLVAKLNKGARMTFQRRMVNNEIWLPDQAHFSGTGRMLLFKGLRIDTLSEYSDYKKFTVETSVTFSSREKR
jgi:hypothetical protein